MKRAALAVAVVVVLFVPAPAADATRPVPGYPYTDRCVNVAGTQPAYLLVGSGPYRPVPGRPGFCYSWRRVR